MKHLSEGLIKQRGVVKINLKDQVFRDYNICITKNEWGDLEYGIVLLNMDIVRDSISSSAGKWFIEYYNDELNHTGNINGNILEVWEPDNHALSVIKTELKKHYDCVDPNILKNLIKNNCKLIWKR